MVVPGDGEDALVHIVRRVERGGGRSQVVPGTAWPDLSTLPVLDHFACYEPVYAAPDRMAQRPRADPAAPMNCQFCEVSRDAAVYDLPRKDRRRSLARLTDDVDTFVERWQANSSSWSIHRTSMTSWPGSSTCWPTAIPGSRSS